jgi:hypothetical protein
MSTSRSPNYGSDFAAAKDQSFRLHRRFFGRLPKFWKSGSANSGIQTGCGAPERRRDLGRNAQEIRAMTPHQGYPSHGAGARKHFSPQPRKTPRGQLIGGEILALLMTAGAGAGAGFLQGGTPESVAAALATLPMMSPRFVGETAYYAGRAAGRGASYAPWTQGLNALRAGGVDALSQQLNDPLRAPR